MAKVYRLIEIQLRPGVKGEDYEKLLLEEYAPLPGQEGWHFFGLLRGDRGHGEGQYLVVYVADTVEIRDRYDSGEFSEEDQQIWETRAPTHQKIDAMIRYIYTDYVLVGE